MSLATEAVAIEEEATEVTIEEEAGTEVAVAAALAYLVNGLETASTVLGVFLIGQFVVLTIGACAGQFTLIVFGAALV